MTTLAKKKEKKYLYIWVELQGCPQSVEEENVEYRLLNVYGHGNRENLVSFFDNCETGDWVRTLYGVLVCRGEE